MKLNEALFIVKGIHCPNCVAAIEKTMQDESGIRKVFVSTDYTKVHIEYDEDNINLLEIVEKIESVPNKEFKVLSYN
jgi:copper chaperone CopZ